MINSMMSILPVKVWIFWIIAILFLMLYIGIKGFKALKNDNARLAKLIMEIKN